MPWVNINSSHRCSAQEQERVKAGLAAIMHDVMQKEEKGLVISFTECYGLFRAGMSCSDGAALDVRYIGSFPAETKQEMTRRIAQLFQAELGMDPTKVIALYSEIEKENWGRETGNVK